MEKKFLTVRQTARELGIPETVIRRLLKAGNVPGFRTGNRDYINVERFRETLNGMTVAAR